MAFLVTGCGRSGTMFLARLFNELGVRTSHEEFFTAYTGLLGDFTGWLNATGTVGEVSGLAGPHVERLDTTVTVAQLVRNPVAVIASLVGLKDLHPQSHNLANIKYNFRHVPEMSRSDNPVVLAMKYWRGWNRMIRSRAHSVVSYRVEQLSEGKGEDAIRMLSQLGVNTGRTECEEALRQLGKEQNHGPRDPSVSWRTLPAGQLKDDILADALAYGYTLGDLESYCPLGAKCPHCGPIMEKT